MYYQYRWGNNPKRAKMKGRMCRKVATGKMRSVLIEFENGQREITSQRAIAPYKFNGTPFFCDICGAPIDWCGGCAL